MYRVISHRTPNGTRAFRRRTHLVSTVSREVGVCESRIVKWFSEDQVDESWGGAAAQPRVGSQWQPRSDEQTGPRTSSGSDPAETRKWGRATCPAPACPVGHTWGMATALVQSRPTRCLDGWSKRQVLPHLLFNPTWHGECCRVERALFVMAPRLAGAFSFAVVALGLFPASQAADACATEVRDAESALERARRGERGIDPPRLGCSGSR